MRGWITIGLTLMLVGCSTVPRSFEPVNPIPVADFSHALFGEVLEAHVRDGVVNYPAIQTDGRLSAYLVQLERINPGAFATRNEQLAFWINAYNAFAIKGIIDMESPMSLVGRYRYFIGQTYRVGGASINLYDLERSILVEQFHEPLIHFAIVCASYSCPKLQPWVYEPDQLERQLDRVAREFMNDPRRNRFDRTNKVASLSMIFKWFDEDFTKAAGSVLVYITRYLDDPELIQDLLRAEYRIEYLDYNWTLNGIPPKESAHAGSS